MDLFSRAQKIKLVAFDVDGVLTSGEIFYTDNGVEVKAFNCKDGQGMNMLVHSGFLTAIITARTSAIIERRAKDLNVTDVYQGAKNKLVSIGELLEKYDLTYDQIAYVGDDFPDICILDKVGLACCPSDAVDEVKNVCHYISDKKGGHGAVRDVCDILLKSSGKLERFLAHKALGQ